MTICALSAGLQTGPVNGEPHVEDVVCAYGATSAVREARGKSCRSFWLKRWS